MHKNFSRIKLKVKKKKTRAIYKIGRLLFKEARITERWIVELFWFRYGRRYFEYNVRASGLKRGQTWWKLGGINHAYESERV